MKRKSKGKRFRTEGVQTCEEEMMPQSEAGESDNPERIDLEVVKRELFEDLENRKKVAYWRGLSRYVRGKLSKTELDDIIFQTIGEAKYALHNKLIGSIIWNSLYAELPPVDSLQHVTTTIPTAYSKRIKASRRLSNQEAEGMLIQEAVAKNSKKSNIDYSWHSLEIPTLSALKNRLEKTAIESGLDSVDNNCVQLMLHALEFHLKDIISYCLDIVRINRRYTRRVDGSYPFMINVSDLMTTTNLWRSLLGEDSTPNLERINLMQVRELFDFYCTTLTTSPQDDCFECINI